MSAITHKIVLLLCKIYYKYTYKTKSQDIIYNKIVYMHYTNDFIHDLHDLVYLFSDNINVKSDTYIYINDMLNRLYETFDEEALTSDKNTKFDDLVNEEYPWLSAQNRVFLKGKLYRNAM